MTIAQKKITLATDRIRKLESTIKDYVNQPESRAVLNARYDRTSGKHQIYIAETPELESFCDDVSVEVGIIAHLMRSALDNRVYSIAQKHTNGAIKRAKHSVPDRQ